MRNRSGIALTIMVAMIAILGLVLLGSVRVFENMSRQTQLRIDQTKARYLAQAGVMRAIWDWYVSSTATETSRRYAEYTGTTIVGNNLFKVNTKTDTGDGTGAYINSSFVYYNFTVAPEVWFTTGGRKRLRNWRMTNIHTNVAADNIIVTAAKVSWTANAGANQATLKNIVLNGNNFVADGTYANGSTLTGTLAEASRTLASGGTFTGTTTYLVWNSVASDAAPADIVDPVAVTVQWTFKDNATGVESTSHEVIYWGTTTGGTVLQSGAAPTQRTFDVISTGQVNQNTGTAFKVMETTRAVVSGAPGAAALEIIDWDEGDKNQP